MDWYKLVAAQLEGMTLKSDLLDCLRLSDYPPLNGKGVSPKLLPS